LPAHGRPRILGVMVWLVAASLIWAFAFGLIKHHLPGYDPWGVAFVRLALASLVFLPWAIVCRPSSSGLCIRAMLLGMLQFGAMYVFYLAAFDSLAAWQVALWTVLTPIYVALIGSLADRRRARRPLVAALLAVAGALVAEGRLPQGTSMLGVLLVQASNICFAAGQLAYRSLATGTRGSTGGRACEAGLLGWMYLGATVLVALGLALFGGPVSDIPCGDSLAVLLYLGIVSTGVAFWLWNKGAARTRSGRLAAANNLKVPLAILASWVVFQEAAPYLRAIVGLAVILWALRYASAGEAGRS
jgi:drug/metabolite transporter (DMT)-like permease